MVSLATLNDGTPDTKPWLTPVCYNLQTLNVDTKRMVFHNEEKAPLPPEDYTSLYFDSTGSLTTSNYSGTTKKYISNVVLPTISAPFVPQPLNSLWANTGINPATPANMTHVNTLIFTTYDLVNTCQMCYSEDEGQTRTVATSNIPFDNSGGISATYGYSEELKLAVYYSTLQSGTSTDGKYWTLINQSNIQGPSPYSYDFVRYNKFYNKWFWIGNNYTVSAPGNAWGNFTFTLRTYQFPCYQLAINQSNGVMVSIYRDDGGDAPSPYIITSIDGGLSWLDSGLSIRGYCIIHVPAFNSFVALIAGYYCTSITGFDWEYKTFEQMGISYYGNDPLSALYIDDIGALVVGFRSKFGSEVPSLGYQFALNQVFRSTPITGGPPTSLEIGGMCYDSESKGLTIIYYTGECLFCKLTANIIVPAPLTFLVYRDVLPPPPVEEKTTTLKALKGSPVSIVLPKQTPPEYNSHEITEEEGDFDVVKKPKNT